MFSHTCPIFLHNYIITMTKITYITHDNQIHTVEVQNGLTVMEGAVQNDIPGIDADCGGGMAIPPPQSASIPGISFLSLIHI